VTQDKPGPAVKFQWEGWQMNSSGIMVPLLFITGGIVLTGVAMVISLGMTSVFIGI
jgi:hypothetical protein